MECNRDEAIRAREMAEKKISASDFVGARKYVEMAQRLFPSLEGLPQVLAVVEVQAAAQDKVDTDSNWYGILQIDSTADDSLIKKQYRKLALLLHPDKNKGVGAEAAFKVVSEAIGVLSDKSKRAVYDIRLKAATARKAQGANAGRGKNANHHQYQQQQQESLFQKQQQSSTNQFDKTGNYYGTSANSGNSAFFITCPYCHDISGCLTINRNKPVQCLKCRRYYIAVDMRPAAAQGPSGFNQQQVPGPGSQNIPGWPHGTSFKEPASHGGAPPQMPRQSVFGVSAEGGPSANPGTGFAEQAQANGTGAYVQNVWNTVQKQKVEAEKKRKEKEAKRTEREDAKRKAREEEEQRRKADKERKDREKQEQAAKAKMAKDAKEAARKRELENLKLRRKAFDEKLETRKKEEGRQKGPKRIRRMRNGSDDEVEYEEVPELDDDVEEGSERNPPPSSPYVRRSARNRNKVSYRIDSDDEDDVAAKNGHAPAHPPAPSACEPASGAESILEGAGPGLQEHRPGHVDDDMTGDVGKSLPADRAAGKDDLSSSLDREDMSFEQPQPFNPPQPNHRPPSKAKTMQPQVQMEEVGEEINPVKEMAKQSDQNLDENHKSAENSKDEKQNQDVDIADGNHKQAESTLSKSKKRVGDIVDGKQKQVGTSVDGIEKQVESTGRGSVSVAHDSHGKDHSPVKHGVLGTVQSLPVEQLQTGCTLSHPPKVIQETGVSHESDISKEDCDFQNETKEMFVPDPDFYDFDQDRLEKDIHKSQVWALYDDIDGMPRYYAKINRVTRTPKFSCSASWFESLSKGKPLVDGDTLPAGCGKYSLGKPGKHSSVSVFSHRVETSEHVDKSHWIYPKEGQVWAVYKQEGLKAGKEQPEDTKGHGASWSVPILYEMVVVEASYTDSIGVEVCYLSKIAGFKTMFQRNMERSQVKFAPQEVTRRFSHKVPHHVCTGDESDPKTVPAGAWELDPAATPLDLIYPKENSLR